MYKAGEHMFQIDYNLNLSSTLWLGRPITAVHNTEYVTDNQSIL